MCDLSLPRQIFYLQIQDGRRVFFYFNLWKIILLVNENYVAQFFSKIFETKEF